MRRLRPLGALLTCALLVPLLGATPARGRPAPTPGPADPQATLVPAARQLLTRSMHGHRAVSELADQLGVAAARNGMAVAELRQLLTTDPTVWVTPVGRLYYRDPAVPAPAGRMSATSVTASGIDPADAFTLHSRPSSTHVIYLDFDGRRVSNTLWNSQDGLPARTYEGFSLDADHQQFSAAERAMIAEVWRRVAEIYSPFDVDVTTVDPGDPSAFTRNSPSDTHYGVTVLFSDDSRGAAPICGPGCSGVAYLDIFDSDPDGRLQPAWVLTDYGSTYHQPQIIAQTAAHEIGHTLGLEHDGTSQDAYFGGHGNWMPVMGGGDTRAIAQFSKGEYADAVTEGGPQDDLQVIASTGAPLLPDDAANTVGAATPLGAQPSYEVHGLITTRSDLDVYSVAHGCDTPLHATATGIGPGSALDLRLDLMDGTGSVVATDDPPSGDDGAPVPSSTGLDATVDAAAPAGTYYLRVDGVGHGSPVTDGYSDYASLGQYTLTVSGCADMPASRAPGAPTALTTTSHRGTGTISWAPPSDTGTSPLTGYRVQVDGTATTLPPSATTYAVAGLTGGTDHAVSVVAQSDAGSSPAATKTLHTSTWAPDAPPEVTARVAGSDPTRATVTWLAAANPGNAELTGWSVTLTGTAGSTSAEFGASASAAVITGLRPGRYTVSVRPSYIAEETGTAPAGSAPLQVAAAGPTRPRHVRAHPGARGGRSTATVTWRAPRRAGTAAVNGYRVRVLTLDRRGHVTHQRLLAWHSASARRLVVRLHPDRYRFQVRARSDDGRSPWSARSRAVRAR